MNRQQQIKTKATVKTTSADIFGVILEELRLLRTEVMLLLPQEDMEDYAHPKRIQASFQRAIKNYPPVSLWK